MSRNQAPRSEQGLQSDALRGALVEALRGKPQRLEEQLCFHSGLPGVRPNLKLAAAFGAEVAQQPGNVLALLERFASVDASVDDPRVFLPIVAAHGFAQRIREQRDEPAAWNALGLLAADERGHVRVGVLDALLALGIRTGGADALLANAEAWRQSDDRELRFGSAALAIETFAHKPVIATLTDPEALLAYLSAVIDDIDAAPRAAERSQGRRRALRSLPKTLAATAAALRAGSRGIEHLRELCARTTHPDLRAMLSQALEALRHPAHGQSAATIEALRKALEASAKPDRHAARVRVPVGQGRGRRSRSVR
jgi:hypothetical protein